MFKQVKQILPNLLERHGFHEQANTIYIVQLFEQYLKENCSTDVKNNCTGMYILNKCFYIGVTANAAAQEMQLHKESLIEYLNSNSEDKPINDIRFKVQHKS